MVIVASIALATMVSNDLVMPVLLRRSRGHTVAAAGRVLWIRRVAILLLALVAYSYYRSSSDDSTLASYGLMAFAAVAQFAPGVLGGLYWRGASRKGVEAGMLLGFATWIYTLLLPAMTMAGGFDTGWLLNGPFGISWLRPQQLFGMSGWDSLAHGTFWSLLANVGALMVVSARWRPGVDERLRAAPFLDPYSQRPAVAGAWPGHVHVADLLTLAERVVGERHAHRAFVEQANSLGRELQSNAVADRAWVQFTERLLAASIGAASARLVLTSLLRGSGMELGEVVAVLDEAGQELRFNREILSTTLENISAAVSVVDPEMRLTAWNRRYQELFGYPDGMLYVGRPVADLIRYNAERGELGEGDTEDQIERRIRHMRAGSPHVFERTRSDGKVVEMRGQALPGGGYVTSYNDITDYKRAERALLEANRDIGAARGGALARGRGGAAIQDPLPGRHQPRRATAAQRRAPVRLGPARQRAEQRRATPPRRARGCLAARRRGIARRPARRVAAGCRRVAPDDRGLRCRRADRRTGRPVRTRCRQPRPAPAGTRAADLGAQRPPPVAPGDAELHRQRPALHPPRPHHSGHAPARRPGGTAGVGYRPGHPRAPHAADLQRIPPLPAAIRLGRAGPGPGSVYLPTHLAPAAARTQCAQRSRQGQHVLDPAAARVAAGQPVRAPGSNRTRAATRDDSLAGLRVLCVDNDQEILDGMRALLGRWQVEVITAATVNEALAKMALQPDVMLVDYHLHDRLDGLDTLDALQAVATSPLPGALLTADGRDELKQLTRARGYRLLTKPVKPASLRAFLSALHEQARSSAS